METVNTIRIKNKNFRTDPEGMTEGKGGNQITEKRQIS